MADFQQTRDSLQQGRAAAEQTRIELYASGQRLKALDKQLEALDRQKGDNNEAYLQQRHDLERRIREEKAVQAKQQDKHNSLRDRLSAVQKDFDLFIDPRREL